MTQRILEQVFGDSWKAPWRREWQPTPVYTCLENNHGRRSLKDYSPWGHKESDMTEQLSTTQHSSQSVRQPICHIRKVTIQLYKPLVKGEKDLELHCENKMLQDNARQTALR